MTEQARPDERAQLILFLTSLKGNKAAQELLSSLRVLSKGLFVDERAVSAVVEHYQAWLERQSQSPLYPLRLQHLRDLKFPIHFL